jgi:hypothetical protein
MGQAKTNPNMRFLVGRQVEMPRRFSYGTNGDYVRASYYCDNCYCQHEKLACIERSTVRHKVYPSSMVRSKLILVRTQDSTVALRLTLVTGPIRKKAICLSSNLRIRSLSISVRKRLRRSMKSVLMLAPVRFLRRIVPERASALLHHFVLTNGR